MDHQYGIATKNRFAFLGDEDEDPYEVISKNKAKTEAEKKPTKPKAKKGNAAEDKTSAQEHDNTKRKEAGDRPQSKQADRGRGGGLRNREPREIRDNDGDRRPPRRQGPRDNTRDGKTGDENVPPEFRERPEGGFRRRDDKEVGGFDGERGRGRGRGGRGRGGRGGERGGRGGERGGGFGPRGDRKREFDRHSGSGTGIKPTEKKEGRGAHNWGSFNDDPTEQPQTNPTEETQEKPEANESVDAENVNEEDAQPQQMTLDEWKALKTQEGKAKPAFNIRQAGEGVDSGQWKEGFEYQKKVDEDEDEEEDEEDEHIDHHSRKQLVTDIRITFNDNPRRGRGRRGGNRGGMEGRGGNRGGMDGRAPARGPPRGFGGKESAPRFDDESDFPSLLKTAA